MDCRTSFLKAVLIVLNVLLSVRMSDVGANWALANGPNVTLLAADWSDVDCSVRVRAEQLHAGHLRAHRHRCPDLRGHLRGPDLVSGLLCHRSGFPGTGLERK